MYGTARTLFLALLTGLLAGASSAMPMITIDVAGGDPAQDVTNDGSFTGPDANGVTTWMLSDTPVAIIEGGQEVGLINSWTAQMKPDPFVTNNINVTNTTNTDQTYIATVVLPVSAFNYDALSGSVGVSVTDDNGQGGLTLDRDDPITIFEGRINGALALGLDFDDLPVTEADCNASPNTPGCTATTSKNQPEIAAGPDVANDISLTLRFVLSPGDSAAFTSRFEIVPEPATAVLLGLGLTALGFGGRRRR